jgi:O-antigen ligase
VASRARQSVAPLYLFLCLVLGGSAQAIYGNMVLRLLGLAIIAWAAMSTREGALLRPARQLVLIALLGLVVAALQLVPLPATVWTHLGGRQPVALGYTALGLPIPSFPLSLTPYQSLDAILALIPPLAMFCAMVRLKAYHATWLVAALIAGTFLGILLGALQVASSDPMSSPWYLYAEASFGVATGFFANANHMATLLVIVLPFLAALLAAARRGNVQRYSALLAVVAGAGLVLVVGILLNRSIAGYVLAFPVLAASALVVLRKRSPLRRWAIALAGLFLVGAVGALASSSIRGQSFGLGAETSVQSREEILSTTGAALRDFLPFGSGLGSFPQVYALYENHDRVTATYVNHAHNDYAEIALETGVAGIIVMALFLLWWGASVGRVWRSGEAGPYARAASIASAAILVHSLVDFPLRTAAISTCFAMCLALLADRRAPAANDKSDLRPTRHIVLR